MRGRRREGLGVDCRTGYKKAIRRSATAVRWGHDSLRVPRPDPPLLPSIIFPLGPPFCGDQCRAERALGNGASFTCGQEEGACAGMWRRKGNEWAAKVERRYTIQRTIRWLKNRCQVGTQF